MKKTIIAFAALVSVLILCSCGQGAGATSAVTRNIYSDPRTYSDAVLVADVNKVWDEIVEAPHTFRGDNREKLANRYDFVVLECTVRTVLEEQKRGYRIHTISARRRAVFPVDSLMDHGEAAT